MKNKELQAKILYAIKNKSCISDIEPLRLEPLSSRAGELLKQLVDTENEIVSKENELLKWVGLKRKQETFETSWTELIANGFIGLYDAQVKDIGHIDGPTTQGVVFTYILRNPLLREEFLATQEDKNE